MYKKRILWDSFFMLVAGARFERTSSGYEPDEIPLLHPALKSILPSS